MLKLFSDVIRTRTFGSSATVSKRIGSTKLKEYREKRALKALSEDPTDARARLSRNLIRILRRDAQIEGIPVREDGYVRVSDLLQHPTLHSVELATLEKIVKQDSKQRFHLYRDKGATENSIVAGWWICVHQGPGLTNIELDMRRIDKDAAPPLAIHGTPDMAWKLIARNGLSRMARDHIHLAQNIADYGVIRDMRTQSRVLIYIDVEKAMHDDIAFFESRNGMILTPGNEAGILEPKFFKKVERITERTTTMSGWRPVPARHPLLAETNRDLDDWDEAEQWEQNGGGSLDSEAKLLQPWDSSQLGLL